MATQRHNAYTVNQRITDLQARVLALETENKSLRAWVESELQTRINDARNLIQGQIRIPVDGAPGRDGTNGVDGAQGLQGIQGERGDCLIPNSDEASAALKKERLYLAQRHAKLIAPIVDRLEFERTKNLSLKSFDSHSFWHFKRLLAEIQERIEKLS